VKKTVNPRSLKNLRKWQKGESGNPGGRPRKPITEALLSLLAEVNTRDHQKRTFAELIATAQVRKALKGNTMAAKEIADRTEGKAGQRLEMTFDTPTDFDIRVRFVDSDAEGGVPSP
jgi:uncharacterized protein DUF5681